LIMRGGGIRRCSQQSRREESRERPLYVLWLSYRLSWITCQTCFLHRETGSEVGESGGWAPAGEDGRVGRQGTQAEVVARSRP
jgi:hypothetical protein